MKSLNSLIIIISNNKLNNNTNKAGVWVQDIAVAYFNFKGAGEVITVASPHGGQISLDKISTGRNPLCYGEAAQWILGLAHNKREDLKNQISTIV